MPDVRTLADQLWRGELDTTSHHPVAALQTAGEEIASGVFFYKGIASANTIDTGSALVMLDTGSRADTRPLHEAVRAWIPERKILAPGDLFIWATPNAGNPQKVQRYAGDWAVALREMAALGAELMIPGHGLPIFGADRVRTALADTAELLETIE